MYAKYEKYRAQKIPRVQFFEPALVDFFFAKICKHNRDILSPVVIVSEAYWYLSIQQAWSNININFESYFLPPRKCKSTILLLALFWSPPTHGKTFLSL